MATTMKLIAKTTLGSSAANIEFTSIPGTYTDLLFLGSLRSNRAGSAKDDTYLEFNGSSTNLSSRGVEANGATASSFSAAVLYGPLATGSTATADTFASGEVYIPNYAGSANKSVSISTVSETNATTAFAYATAGLWSNTAAITSILIKPVNGTNFVSGSSAFLYGILKA